MIAMNNKKWRLGSANGYSFSFSTKCTFGSFLLMPLCIMKFCGISIPNAISENTDSNSVGLLKTLRDHLLDSFPQQPMQPHNRAVVILKPPASHCCEIQQHQPAAALRSCFLTSPTQKRGVNLNESSKLEPPETVLGTSGTSSLWTKSIISPSTTGSDPTGGTRPFAATPNNQTTSPFSAPGTPNAYQGGGGSGYPGSVPAAGSPFTPQGGASGGGSSTPCPPPHYAHSPAPSGSSTPVGFNSHGPPQGPPQFPPGLYNGPGPNSPYYNNNYQSGGPPPRPLQPQRNQSYPPYSAPGPFPPGGPPNHNNFGPPPFGPPHPFQPQIPPGPHLQPGPQNAPGMPGLLPDRIPDHGPMPIPRRAAPYFGQPDYRIYELNRRLQQRTEESDNLWWDAFATEFFEDDATLTLTFCLEDGLKRYRIERTLIPRYFRSIFEGGVTDLSYNLRHPKESFHNTSITLDCEQCTMITLHGKSMFTQVCTEGRLILEFTFDDLMRMKSWHFAVRTARELVPRSAVVMHAQQQDPGMMEQLSKNITRQGLTNSTLNYLRLCVILEPMQELMSRHKAYALSPRDCLKTTLFQKWQRMVAPPETARPQSKRRKRKGSASNSTGGGVNPPATNKKRSPGPSFSLASQDVMVVGEPSLMGGEFGDEDERMITRLENSQYDAAAALDNEPFGADSPLPGAGPNSWQPAQDRPPHGKKKKQLLIM